MLKQVIEQLVNNSAREINYPVSPENVEQVLMDLEYSYNLVVTQSTPITIQVMQTVIQAVKSWQQNTQQNFM